MVAYTESLLLGHQESYTYSMSALCTFLLQYMVACAEIGQTDVWMSVDGCLRSASIAATRAKFSLATAS